MTESSERAISDQARWFILFYLGVPVALLVCITAMLITGSTWPMRIFLVLLGAMIAGRVILRWRVGLPAMTLGARSARALTTISVVVSGLQLAVAVLSVAIAFRIM